MEEDVKELEALADLSNEDIVASIDPSLAKLLKLAKALRQAKDTATKLKALCEAGIVSGDVCSYVDRIALLPPDKQAKVMKALMLREVLKSLRKEVT